MYINSFIYYSITSRDSQRNSQRDGRKPLLLACCLPVFLSGTESRLRQQGREGKKKGERKRRKRPSPPPSHHNFHWLIFSSVSLAQEKYTAAVFCPILFLLLSATAFCPLWEHHLENRGQINISVSSFSCCYLVAHLVSVLASCSSYHFFALSLAPHAHPFLCPLAFFSTFASLLPELNCKNSLRCLHFCRLCFSRFFF